MKKNNLVLCLVLLVAQAVPVAAVQMVSKKLFGESSEQQQPKIFMSLVEEKRARLAELEKEKQQLLEDEKKLIESINAREQEIKAQLGIVYDELQKTTEDEFLTRKEELLNEQHQAVKKMQQSIAQIKETIDQRIKLLQDYLKDPDLTDYRKELDAAKVYSFEDLERFNQLIQKQEQSIAQLTEQEANIDSELASRKRIASVTEQEFKKKKQDYTEDGKLGPSFALNQQQKTELFKLEEQLYADKKNRDRLQFKEIEHKKELIREKIFVARLHLDLLKELLRHVKSSIRVGEADIAFAKDELAKKRQQLFAEKESLIKKSEQLNKDYDVKENKLQELSKKYDIALGTGIDDLTKEPAKSIIGYGNFLELASHNAYVRWLQREKDLLDAELAIVDAKLDAEALHIDIKDSYRKIAERSFDSEQEIKAEAKKYDSPKASTNADLSLYSGKKTAAEGMLSQQKRALEKVKALRQEIQEKWDTIFKDHKSEYNRNLEQLNSIEEYIKNRIETLSKTIALYADIISIIEQKAKHIQFILDELTAITVWQRPQHAISWAGIQNIMPSIQIFLVDIKNYIVNFDRSIFWGKIKNTFGQPWNLFLFIIRVLGLLLALWLFRRFMILASAWLLNRCAREGFFFKICLSVSVLFGFITTYFLGIAVWTLLFIILRIYAVDPYPTVLFYLATIPYVIYLINRFISYFARFNVRHEYPFLSETYQRRFITVASISLYASAALLFFRAAFMLITYHRTELPAILSALNYIILQFALIFLITKDLILAIIPTKTVFWQQIYMKVDQYYYLLLLALGTIIVMINPYVGYGQLVRYVMLRLIYTAMLIVALYWLHHFAKKIFAKVFFFTREGVTKERFAYAKTLYSLLTIGFILLLITVTVVIGAKIWGWPEQLAQISKWSDVVAWLESPIMFKQTETISDLSLLILLKLLFFIFMGFVAAFALNRFVLSRVFDVLAIDPGVQNTVTSITRYMVITFATILGLQAVGLGVLLLPTLGVVGVGLGWVLKDPLADLLAYFIILVQRPVKIGDFVELDHETFGVVRKITPRSVILRKKNSATLIVPNTKIINNKIKNWNYTRGFIAFDDIIVNVSYKEDPVKAKELLLKILSENQYVLKSPAPIVRLDDFNQVGFHFMVRGFLSSNYTLDQWVISSDIRLEIARVLRENGMQIAVPPQIYLGKDGFYGKDDSAAGVQ